MDDYDRRVRQLLELARRYREVFDQPIPLSPFRVELLLAIYAADEGGGATLPELEDATDTAGGALRTALSRLSGWVEDVELEEEDVSEARRRRRRAGHQETRQARIEFRRRKRKTLSERGGKRVRQLVDAVPVEIWEALDRWERPSPEAG